MRRRRRLFVANDIPFCTLQCPLAQRLQLASYCHTARLNQWAHWARAQDPGFFLIEGPPTGCGEIFFKTNYLIVYATAHRRKLLLGPGAQAPPPLL